MCVLLNSQNKKSTNQKKVLRWNQSKQPGHSRFCSSWPAAWTAPGGAQGPELVAQSRSSETARYAEVGLEFSTWGDFVALTAPSRWKSPIATGGSLSWLNPIAWSEDAGRTVRILAGEAVVVGGISAAVAASSGSDEGSGSSSPSPSSPGPSGPTPPPTRPPAIGGDTPPPEPPE